MGNRAKSLLGSVFFNEFHHRTKLKALLFCYFVFKRHISTGNYKTLSFKGTSHANSDSEWGNESLVQQILVVLLCGNLGSSNKTTYSEFELKRYLSYKFRLRIGK
jgi:hypothetical protein